MLASKSDYKISRKHLPSLADHRAQFTDLLNQHGFRHHIYSSRSLSFQDTDQFKHMNCVYRSDRPDIDCSFRPFCIQRARQMPSPQQQEKNLLPESPPKTKDERMPPAKKQKRQSCPIPENTCELLFSRSDMCVPLGTTSQAAMQRATVGRTAFLLYSNLL